MPVFISYSHADRDFVDRLAIQLVQRNTHVWVDTWELNVGDSIVTSVQNAIQDASALVVVLSKTSVESEWCKKELSAGLIRELDERRVVVLPALVDDCKIPVFLRDKKYADFRSNYDAGWQSLSEAIARVTAADQGRIEEQDGNVDWSLDSNIRNGVIELFFTVVQTSNKAPITILTEIIVTGNDVVTGRYKRFVEAGIDWLGQLTIVEILFDLANAENFNLVLDSVRPQEIKLGLRDPRRNAEFRVVVRCRKLGQDNGKDQLLNVNAYLGSIRDWMRSVSRRPNAEEWRRMLEILGSGW